MNTFISTASCSMAMCSFSLSITSTSCTFPEDKKTIPSLCMFSSHFDQKNIYIQTLPLPMSIALYCSLFLLIVLRLFPEWFCYLLPFFTKHLPFGTSSKNTWSCVLLFHWENWLTSYPFLHYSPIVTVIANFFVSKIDAATLYFYFSLLYYLLYFIIDFSHIDFSLNVFSEDK